MTLVPVDTSSELAVSDYLTRARDWLATAVEKTGPEQIAAAKAEIATAAEATKQLGLSKEIREDAVEMVRRAEYALRKSLNNAQAEGFVASRADGASVRDGTFARGQEKVSPKSFFNSSNEYEGAGAMGALTSDEFDEVITDAKAEGNLSRANVARKAREKVGATPRATPRRALTDQFFDAAFDLTKITERIDRLVNDDRFPQNAEKVGAKHRPDLLRAVELLSKALDRLTN